MAPSTQWNSMRTSADLRQILEGLCLGGYYKRCKPGSRVLYLGLQLEGTAYGDREYMVAVTFNHQESISSHIQGGEIVKWTGRGAYFKSTPNPFSSVRSSTY